MTFLGALLSRVLGYTALEQSPLHVLKEEALIRIQALVMSYIILGLLLLAMGINIVQGVSGILPFLSTLFVAQALGVVWIYAGGKGRHVMLGISLMLIGLGVYLLLVNPVGGAGSLFWFLLFPPMLILCSGLRAGSILFSLFYIFLLLMLLSPLDRYLHTPYSMAVRGRFLLTMLGSCFFSMLAEYARMRTHAALREALIRLDNEARNDALTGLGNRRDFIEFYRWVSGQSRRSQKPCALALVDLDFFKKVNDTYGHLVGDEVLKHVADTLRASLRETDRVFRWGGEEFLIVLHESSRHDALQLAERLRIIIDNSPCQVGDMSIPVSVSIGLYCGVSEENPDECVGVADTNLYAAKQQGRNRVIG